MTGRTPYHEFLLEGLTDQQKAVVSAPIGESQLVLAGAGTGKTTCLTRRLVWLAAEGVSLPNIVALTFTNRAAREMAQRVCTLLGTDPHEKDVPLPNMGTFHAVSARILRKFSDQMSEILAARRFTRNFTILDEDGSQSILRQASLEEGSEGAKWKVEKGHLRILSMEMEKVSSEKPWDHELIAELEAQGVTIDLVQTGTKAASQKAERISVANIVRKYSSLKQQHDYLDYDDLIRMACILLEHCPEASQSIEMVLCDEYQDTSTMQERLLQALRGSFHRSVPAPLTAVGDNDQLIYRWRGAKIDNILGLQDRCTEVVRRDLTLNFRSGPEILDVANLSLIKNTLRLVKTLICADGRISNAAHRPQLHEFPDAHDEARWVLNGIQRQIAQGRNLEEIAVLVRKSNDLSQLDWHLARNKIPYRVIAGRRFAERMEVRLIAAWIRVLLNPLDNDAATRILTNPKRGLGPKSLHELQKLSTYGMLSGIPRAIDSGILNKPAAAGARRVHEIYNDLLRKAEDFPLDLGLFCEAIMDLSEIRPSLMEELENLDDTDKDATNRVNKKLDHLKDLVEIARRQTGNLSQLLDSLSVSDIQPDEQKEGLITLATIHGAKGAEWEWVHILALEQGSLPIVHSDFATDEKEKLEMLEEERRLLHVACTRAKHHLSLSWSRNRREFTKEPSIFIPELSNTLIHKKH